MDKILRNIIASNTIAKGDSVIIGFSGGPDSLTLLYALNSMKSAYSLSLMRYTLITGLDRETARQRQSMLRIFAIN